MHDANVVTLDHCGGIGFVMFVFVAEVVETQSVVMAALVAGSGPVLVAADADIDGNLAASRAG